MNEHDAQLSSLLRAFRRRIRALLMLRMGCWGAVAAGMLALALVIVDHATAWYITTEQLAMLLALGALTGIIVALRRPLPDLAVAVTVERRCNLKERASTAVALTGTDSRDAEFHDLIAADAVRHMAAQSPRELFPITMARHQKMALLVWGCVVVLFLLPSIPWLQSPQVRAERLAMQSAGKALKQEAKAIKQRPELDESKVAQQVARNMQKLGVELEKNRIPKREALVRLNKLDEEMAKAEQQIAREQAQRTEDGMQKAANAFKEAQKNRTPAERAASNRARQKMANGVLQDKLTQEERNALSREQQMESVARALESGDLQMAGKQLRNLGQTLASQKLSEAERKQLAEALKQLSAATKNNQSTQEMSKATEQAAREMQKNTQQGQKSACEKMAGIPCPAGRPSASSPGMRSAQRNVSSTRQNMACNRSGNCTKCGSSQCNGSCSGNGNKPGGGNRMSANRQGGSRPGGGSDSSEGGGGAGYLGKRTNERPGATYNQHYEQTQMDLQRPAYSVDVRGEPDQANRTNVPYYEVYPAYQRQAESAVDNEQIPPSERQRVKDYFTALDPAAQ